MMFGCGKEDVDAILQPEDSITVKLILLDFYMMKSMTELKLKEYTRDLNKYYLQQFKPA